MNLYESHVILSLIVKSADVFSALMLDGCDSHCSLQALQVWQRSSSMRVCPGSLTASHVLLFSFARLYSRIFGVECVSLCTLNVSRCRCRHPSHPHRAIAGAKATSVPPHRSRPALRTRLESASHQSGREPRVLRKCRHMQSALSGGSNQ